MLKTESKQTFAPPSSSSGHYRVLDIQFLSEKTYRLRFERKGFQFRAGQLFNVGVPGMGVNREYSIYSGINDPYVDVLIREVEGGMVSGALKKCRPGDLVEVHGPYGEFVLANPNSANSYLFIGTGTGVAPFHCFAKSYPQLNYKLLHGVRLKDEQYDREDYAPGRYVSCVSQENGGNFKGRVSDYLRQNKVDPSVVSYLCGNRSMINECYELLRAQGVPSNNIFTEVFF
jgi:NAD(P)H-flavin reductase